MSFIKTSFARVSGQLSSISDWCYDETRQFATNLMVDLRSLRALFNYVYLLLYVFLCVWAALFYAKDSLNTAIVTTGSIVTGIFAAYVWSTTKEKESGLRQISPIAIPQPQKRPHENEEGASD